MFETVQNLLKDTKINAQHYNYYSFAKIIPCKKRGKG